MTKSDKNNVLVFGGALAAVMLLAFAFGPESPRHRAADAPEQSGIPRHQDAYYSAQSIIERQLTSPRSARWPSHREVRIWDMDNGWVAINGHVDADNAYGTAVRSPFLVTLSKTVDGWRAETLVFDGREIF